MLASAAMLAVSPLPMAIMQALRSSFYRFDHLIGMARTSTLAAVPGELDYEIIASARQLCGLLGECGTAQSVQRTCDFARRVLAGGRLRRHWMGILDVDREITRAAVRRRIDMAAAVE